MDLHYWYSHYSNQFPLQLQKSFLAVFIFSFVPTTLGVTGVTKTHLHTDDQQDTWRHSLCCPNGINYVDMLTKNCVKDRFEFRSENPIKNLEELNKIGPCYIIDEAGKRFYTNLQLIPETGVWLYKSDEHPCGMELVLEEKEHFGRMFLNGKTDQTFICVELSTGKFTLKIIGTLPKVDDQMFTVSRIPKEFGELVSIKRVREGEYELSKGTTDYFLWTELKCGTEEKGTTGFSKLFKLDSIPSLPADGEDETYSLGVGGQFYPWLETRGVSTKGEWKQLTPKDYEAKPDFPWFVNIYQSGSHKTTLVGTFYRNEDSIGPEVPFENYIGQRKKYLFPEKTMKAAIQELTDCTFTVSRNLALYNTTMRIKWNVAEYSEGFLRSLHRLANLYETQGFDLLFCGTFKFLVDNWELYNFTHGFTLIRCKQLDDRMMMGSRGRFTPGLQYLFDIDQNEFITAEYDRVEETDKEECIFKITGMQHINYGPQVKEAESVYYIYVSKVSGMYYRIRGTLVERGEDSFRLKVGMDKPFSQGWDEYSFAISRLKTLRVPEDASSVSRKSFDDTTCIVELTYVVSGDTGEPTNFQEVPVNEANDVSERAKRLLSIQASSSGNAPCPKLEPNDLPPVNVESDASECFVYRCNQYGEIINEKMSLELLLDESKTQLRLPEPQELYQLTCNRKFVTYIKNHPYPENVQSSSSNARYFYGIPTVPEPVKLPDNLKFIHEYSECKQNTRASVVVERFQPEQQVPSNNLVEFYRRIPQTELIRIDPTVAERFVLSDSISGNKIEVGSFYLEDSQTWVFMHRITTVRNYTRSTKVVYTEVELSMSSLRFI